MTMTIGETESNAEFDNSNKRLPFVVFGYGSLIFKPPPHAITRTPGYLKGYVRRFAQKSHDHRGTPEKPGRVVTLIHKEQWDAFSAADPFPEDDIVWGVGYTIDPNYEAEVKDYLDYREKDGYTIEAVDVYGVQNGLETIAIPKVNNSVNIGTLTAKNSSKLFAGYCTYVGLPNNPSFIGSEPIETLARHIWTSVGPSGNNKDYLYDLATAVRQLAPESYDSHLYAIEARLKELDKEHFSNA